MKNKVFKKTTFLNLINIKKIAILYHRNIVSKKKKNFHYIEWLHIIRYGQDKNLENDFYNKIEFTIVHNERYIYPSPYVYNY